MNLLEKLEEAREKAYELELLLKQIGESETFNNTPYGTFSLLRELHNWQNNDYIQVLHYIKRRQQEDNDRKAFEEREKQQKEKTLDEKLDEILKILREELNDKPKEASMDEMEGNTENGSRA